jgi:hypothetical protein
MAAGWRQTLADVITAIRTTLADASNAGSITAAEFTKLAGLPSSALATAWGDGYADVGGAIAALAPPGTVFCNGIATGAVQLSTLASAGYTEGQAAYVASVGAVFRLQLGALTTDAITVVNATGKAGYQWVRINAYNKACEAQATWAVDPQNSSGTASDENTGLDSTHALRSYYELSRRLFNAEVSTALVVTVLSNLQAGDNPAFSLRVVSGGTLTFLGVPTVLYSGTVTTFTAESTVAAADDNQLSDTSVPVSYTASGMLADGVLFQRTNSTAIYWYGMKDLTAKTLRCSNPVTLTGTVTALAPGDTYQAVTLPTIGPLRFPFVSLFNGMTYRFLNHVDSNAPIATTPIGYSHSWKTAGLNGQFATSINAAMNASALSASGRPALTLSFIGGMLRSTAGSTSWSWSMFFTVNRLSIQGGGLTVVNGANLSVSGRLTVCDCTTRALLSSSYALIQMDTGACVGGKGNSGAMIGVNHASTLRGTVAAPFVAGSTSAPNQIEIATVLYPLAIIPAAGEWVLDGTAKLPGVQGATANGAQVVTIGAVGPAAIVTPGTAAGWETFYDSTGAKCFRPYWK